MHLPRALLLAMLIALTPARLARADDPPDQTTLMVPMRDGVELATDVYLPKLRPGEKCPVVLVRTPYGRGQVAGAAHLATAHGIAIVGQDLRGRGDSKGEKLPFSGAGYGERGDDGADTVRWAAKQPWSNGRVGTYGPSALGIVQNFTGVSAPEGLAAQWIEVAASSLYHHAAYPGGVLREEQVVGWTRGNRFEEQALDLIKQHPLFDSYWKLFDTRGERGHANAPATHLGGWFDTFVEGTIDSFRGWQLEGGPGARGRQRLVIGPWTHSGRGRTRQGEVDLPEVSLRTPPQADPIRWFARWLRDEKNGVDDDAAVAYYVLGADEWRTASAWPPSTTLRTLHLRASGELTDSAPAAAEPVRTFAHDPKDPSPTRGGRNLTIPAGPADQRPVEARKDALVWTSAPLEKPLEVVGVVRARLHVLSSGKDLDVHVRLTDVGDDGRSLLVVDGARRASLRAGFERPEALVPGEPALVAVDVGSVAWRFAAGHRIRVVVTGANAPRFSTFPDAVTGTVFSSPERASAIDLPVAGGKLFR